MSPDKWTELNCKAFFLGRLLEFLGKDDPTFRELRIQNSKLERILTKPQRGTRQLSTSLLAGRSLKKANKANRKQAIAVTVQAKKVQRLFDSSFKQWLRSERHVSNAEYAAWKANFDGSLNRQVEKVKRQIKSEALRRALGKGLLR